MRFFGWAALSLGVATIAVASASNAAAPLPAPEAAALPQPDAARPQSPQLAAAVVQTDSGLSIGTPLPQPGAAPAIAPEAPAASLAALVERNDDIAGLDPQMQCLASAIYFEAGSESLQGKLAVARVIINRAASGRFADTLCGVVTQRGQFSFVRGGRIPAAPTATHQWSDSVGIARVAAADAWESEAEGALFFHSRRITPHWNRQRMTQIQNHIFYR